MKLWDKLKTLLALPYWMQEIHEVLIKIYRGFNDLNHSVITLRNELQQERPTVIVLWGTCEDTKDVVCFTIQVMGQQAVFQPQVSFKLQRWLLLGDDRLRVQDIMVGNELQKSGISFADGIAGRYGQGDYRVCQIGSMLRFQISR